METLAAYRTGIFAGPNAFAFPAGHDRAQADFFLGHKESLHRFQQPHAKESILLSQRVQKCWSVSLRGARIPGIGSGLAVPGRARWVLKLQ